MFAWSQLDFSVIPVSISAVSLTSRQTWQNAFVFVPSVFGEKFPTAEF
jgi:hypothetical protein